MNSITDKNYWNRHWNKTIFRKENTKHPVARWVDQNTIINNNLKCFEVGCYPGKFLALLGEKGYEINGIDISNKINDMEDWLKSLDYNVGEIKKKDFINFKSTKKYDLVCSFGFIEHFDDWHKIIDKHLDITKENGTCLIEVPNLTSPIYRSLYKILEPNILKNHVPEAMSLERLEKYISKNKYIVVRAEYVGHFYFRFVTKKGRLYNLLENIINSFGKIISLLPNRLSARYIGLVVKYYLSSDFSHYLYFRSFSEEVSDPILRIIKGT